MTRLHTGALRFSSDVAPQPLRETLSAAAWGAVTSAASIGLMATSALLITRAAQRPPVFALAVAMAAVQACALGRGVSRYAQRLSVHRAALHTLSRLRVWLYDVVEPLVPNGLPGRGAGSVVSGFVDDVEIVSDSVARQRTAAVDVGAATAIGTAVAALILPSAAGLLLAAAAAMVMAALVASRVLRTSSAAYAAERARLADAVVDSVRSARELVLYGHQDVVDGLLDDVRRRATAASTRRAAAVGVARCVTMLAAGAGLIAVVLAGVAAHNAGALSGVALAVLVFVALAVLEQAGALPATLAATAAGDAAAQRLLELAALSPVVQEVGPRQPAGVCTRKPSLDAITLRHVHVPAPRGDGPALLEDVSLRVRRGDRVAIVGRSGSGKTSTLHTVLHFLEPATGQVTINDVNLVDMPRRAIAQCVAWLPETTHIFDTTLANNLRLTRPSATSEDCVEALTRVGLERWFISLSDGLQTRLGATGRALSAGEKQRLGLARALLSDSPTLLLDEPTAHLDRASAVHVLEEVLAARHRSALIVSHDPAVAEIADDVVAISGGRSSVRSGTSRGSSRRAG